MQAAFKEHHALQCGYCTPGMVMAALDLVRRIPDPTEREIRVNLEGKHVPGAPAITNIVKAIDAAAKTMRDG